MDTFIKSQVLQQDQPCDWMVGCERPNVLPLIVPESDFGAEPLLHVVSDVLRAFTDIATLPEQVGGLYLMFRLLNVSESRSLLLVVGH